MTLWPFIAVAAAAFQTLRFVVQKRLAAGRLTATGATLARFLYSAPLLVAALMLWMHSTGHALPPLSAAFWGWAALGGAAQILATVALVLLFQTRHFATGMGFAKTETLHAAALGLAFLGDDLSMGGILAILIGMLGVLLLADPPSQAERRAPRLRRLLNRGVGLGLGAGVLFGVASVAYRGAVLTLPGDSAFFDAAVTLAAATSLQLTAMLAWVVWRDRGQIARLFLHWRAASAVGLTSLGGSFCWFWAFALAPAAYVKAVGQVEIIFALLASWLLFDERLGRGELVGVGLITASVLGLVWLVGA